MHHRVQASSRGLVFTAGIDIVATETGASEFRELAHRRLAPIRLRCGVPNVGTCELVRDGFDRDDKNIRLNQCVGDDRLETAAGGANHTVGESAGWPSTRDITAPDGWSS